MRRPIGVLLLLLCCIRPVGAQTIPDHIPDEPRTSHELHGFLQSGFGSDGMPFWLHHNRYDMVPRNTGAGLGTLYRGRRDIGSGWRADWGAEVQMRSDHSPGESWLPQAWAGLAWRDLQLTAGRWRQTVGMSQQEITAGPTIWSANSRPMTKIKLELADFVGIPLTRDWISLRGGMAHGWFESGRQVEDFYLHEKYIFGKVGRRGTPELYAGLIHMAQWGGYDTNRYGDIPSGLRDFWRIFLGMAGSDRTPDQFQMNRFGNSLGSWQAGLIWRFEPVELWIHKATIFEDNSGYKLRSPEDGVQGINLLFRHRTVSARQSGRQTSINTPSGIHQRSGPGSFNRGATEPQEILTRFTWEFWHTKSQSGPGAADRPPGWPGNRDPDGNRFGGQDNYFNHGVYIEGWSYRGRLIGVPLITFDPERERVTNNRLIGHHVALRHDLPYSSFVAAWSWTRNYGTYEHPFDEALGQHYLALGWEQSLWRMFDLPLQFRLDLGLDSGAYTGNRTGVLMSIGYRFL